VQLFILVVLISRLMLASEKVSADGSSAADWKKNNGLGRIRTGAPFRINNRNFGRWLGDFESVFAKVKSEALSPLSLPNGVKFQKIGHRKAQCMIPKNIKREHIIQTLDETGRSGRSNVPPQRSTKYNLIHNGQLYLPHNGQLYPTKYAISLANRYANGRELEPSGFTVDLPRTTS
jgi:hypothetical protein